MQNKPRNVVGDEQMWAGIIPGLGLMNYILGILTVPVEVFLRRDFGERYFTRMNFLGGLGILILWKIAGSFLGVLSAFNPFGGKGSTGEVYGISIGTIIYFYIIFGVVAFVRIWWRNITNDPVHSRLPGRSWLRPIGSGIMAILNVVLNNLVRLAFTVMRKDKSDLEATLPVLRDVDTFTERFVEPSVVFVLAVNHMAHGNYATGLLLFFSVMALNLYTGLRHQAERGIYLDYRDQMIDAQFYSRFLAGERVNGSNTKARMVRDTAREVERNPDVLPIIEQQNPSLARAIEKLNPKLKRIIRKDDEDDEPEAMLVAA